MIRFAIDGDKLAIYELYCKNFTSNNPAYMQGLFDSNFDIKNCLVNEVNGHVVAVVQTRYIPVNLHQKKIMACFIVWCIRDSSKNNKYLNELVQSVVEQQEYKVLLTYAKHDIVSEYDKLGFESLYRQRLYSFTRNSLDSNCFVGVTRDFDVPTIRNVYNQFVASFDGYESRSNEYYQSLIPFLQAKRYSLAVYYNDQQQAQGYMIYTVEYNKIVVKELIYLNALALTRLLCYGLRNRNNMEVYTSQCENLNKLYPNVRYKEVENLDVRINDLTLFNKLYNCDVDTTFAGMYLEEKPLLLNELTM